MKAVGYSKAGAVLWLETSFMVCKEEIVATFDWLQVAVLNVHAYLGSNGPPGTL